jgi:hypothetical protein
MKIAKSEGREFGMYLLGMAPWKPATSLLRRHIFALAAQTLVDLPD